MISNVTRFSRFSVLVLIACLVFGSSGCFEHVIRCHDDVVRDARVHFQLARDMNAIFGAANVDHFISDFGSRTETPIWNSQTYFAGRYTACLQVPIAIDYEKCGFIGSVGKATIYIIETVRVDISPHGSAEATNKGQWILTQAEWAEFVKSKGNWAKVNIPILTNAPVKNFDEFVRQTRKDFSRGGYQ